MSGQLESMSKGREAAENKIQQIINEKNAVIEKVAELEIQKERLQGDNRQLEAEKNQVEQELELTHSELMGTQEERDHLEDMLSDGQRELKKLGAKFEHLKQVPTVPLYQNRHVPSSTPLNYTVIRILMLAKRCGCENASISKINTNYFSLRGF